MSKVSGKRCTRCVPGSSKVSGKRCTRCVPGSSTPISSNPVSSTPAIVCQYLYVSHCQYFYDTRISC